MTQPTTLFLNRLRTALARPDALTDGELLEAFIRRRDEAAFRALLSRHGPMVWGVCLRVLGNHHDAEDAFQATFLVLARKASRVRPRERVGNWLYGVAYRAALKARALAARRRAKERQAASQARPVAPAPACPDLAGLLDRELQELPATYRAAVVLCDLEGKTRTEAARQLGWPEGTVAGRLARARGLLAKRLGRRGVNLAGALAALGTAGVSVPATAAEAAVRAAANGPASGRVLGLTEGLLRAMLLSRVKVAAALLAVALVGGGGLLFALHLAAGPAAAQGQRASAPAGRDPEKNPPARKTAERQAVDPVAAELRRLEGEWVPVAYESGGEKVEGEAFRKSEVADQVLTIRGGKFKVKSKDGPPQETDLKVDPAARPKTMDRTYTAGPLKGAVGRAIYELDGNTLRICTYFEKEERPRDFAAKESFVLTYRRVVEQPGQLPQGKPALSVEELRGKWVGEGAGIKVTLTFTGERAHWQVDFPRAVKPGEPAAARVNIGADLRCAADAKAGRVDLYLPAYRGDNEAIRRSSHNGLRPVGQLERAADGTIRLRIIPTGYEDLSRGACDYPSAAGLVLRRVSGAPR